MPETSTNPLLATDHLPRFQAIRPDDVLPAVETTLAEFRATLERVLAAQAPRTFRHLARPLEQMSERLARVWSPVRHLHAVMDTPELRAAYEAALPLMTDFHTDLTQNRALFEAYQAIADSADFEQLEAAERRVVENALKEFRLGGVSLEGGERERFKRNAARIAELSSRFSNNVLDATQAFSKVVTDESLLAGLPPSALDLARQAAVQTNESGWKFTLDLPSYLPLMSFAANRALREEMYHAYVTRASELGPNAMRYDNGDLMREILALRREQASLLGFESYAHLSLDRKMAPSPEAVLDFLADLARRSRPVAEAERDELERFARDEHGVTQLEAWDVPYFAEQLKRSKFDFSQEDLRPYFPVPQVMDGMFKVAERLFGVRFESAAGVETWHPDVTYFRIVVPSGQCIGEVYFDLYARAGKRGGAWMDVCRSRSRFGHAEQSPVAYLVCNFTPPVGARPALITHDEVTTLFHEFGHGLHHLLTRVSLPSVSGIAGVEWDAVELPSQFLEHWCYEDEALSLVSGHHESGDALPAALLRKLRAARHFHAGLQMLRQIEFALFDFRLHLEFEPGMEVLERLRAVRDEVSVLPVPEFNRFPHSFGHIFAGGYAAGYYSYKWAEVLASDAFACFEENGIFDAETGRRFREEILEPGGTRDAMESFVAFRGREPDIGALLRHTGIETGHSVNAA